MLITVNLALSLASLKGHKLNVGILDMDIFGPSLPKMMNLTGEPALDKGNFFYNAQYF